MDRSGGDVVTWSITDDERRAFVVASGDRNPIHTDPIAARRLLGGRMLVHGAHALLDVIDQGVTTGLLRNRPSRLTVTFRRGIEPGTPLATEFARGGDVVTARVVDAAAIALEVVITIDPDRGDVEHDHDVEHHHDVEHDSDVEHEHDRVGALPTSTADAVASTTGGPAGPGDTVRRDDASAPDDVAIESMAGVSGRFDPSDHHGAEGDEIVSRLFPGAVGLLGVDTVRQIAAISGVVGMRAPGLRSMSSRYDIGFRRGDDPSTPRRTGLGYRVERVDPRLRRVVSEVDGTLIQATVTAFSPPGPVHQRSVLAGGIVPGPDEFAGRRVLVVGGSRGLGEAAVRLLVAGGADVRFTWHVGATEARAVTADTGARAVCFDVRAGALDPSMLDGWAPTHLTWFATPPTSAGTPGSFSDHWYRRLRAVQVEAFERSVDALVPHGLTDVLWPSSIAVERDDTTTDELAAVRIAGEQTCAALEARHRGVSIVSARLPRLLTDNTVSLLPVEYGDTASTLLAALRTRR